MTASDFSKTLGRRLLSVTNASAKLNALSVASSLIGGYKVTTLPWINSAAEIDERALKIGKEIAEAIKLSGHPSSIVLSGLAEFNLNKLDRKTSGVFFTDSRLSEFLASHIKLGKRPPKIIDPACGSGMLLCQAALKLRSLGISVEDALSNCIFGADLSNDSTRASVIALSSMTSSSATIKKLHSHIISGDSLHRTPQEWNAMSKNGFDYVIANPPWERLRAISHDVSKSINADNHYGDEIPDEIEARITDHRRSVSKYSASVSSLAKLQGSGDKDLYKLFLELAIKLRSQDGTLCILVPAGLIRAASAVTLREELVRSSAELHYVLFDNRSRFFEIDSRFKFLAVIAKHKIGKKPSERIKLSTGTCKNSTVQADSTVSIRVADLSAIRRDLTMPEVRSKTEWDLFHKISTRHKTFGDESSLWSHSYVREVDMTLSRRDFKNQAQKGTVPLIEGRMIHQYRFGCKKYISGTGRKAVWINVTHEIAPNPVPQFHISTNDLSPSRAACLAKTRAGFCDITGQTNERTVLASIIPSGVICGNKVPTIHFKNASHSDELKYAWVGIANSFCFDWLTRMVCTTSLNFFILDSIPIPSGTKSLETISKIAKIVEAQFSSKQSRIDGMAQDDRARVEALVFHMYGMSVEEVKMVLSAFPQVDKLQPPIAGEEKSTITFDYVMAEYCRISCKPDEMRQHTKRVELSKNTGAKAFVPNQFTK
jgi:Alw26I/Eco31I/Esp3I family type II restriction m6 adenine DNA methyltransferase